MPNAPRMRAQSSAGSGPLRAAISDRDVRRGRMGRIRAPVSNRRRGKDGEVAQRHGARTKAAQNRHSLARKRGDDFGMRVLAGGGDHDQRLLGGRAVLPIGQDARRVVAPHRRRERRLTILHHHDLVDRVIGENRAHRRVVALDAAVGAGAEIERVRAGGAGHCRADDFLGRRAPSCEPQSEVGDDVAGERGLAAGDADDADAGAARTLATGREAFDGRDQLVIVARGRNAAIGEEPVIGVGRADQRAGMRLHRGRPDLGSADLQHHDRLARVAQHRGGLGEGGGVLDRLQHDANDRRRIVGREPAQVVGRRHLPLAAHGDHLGQAGCGRVHQRDRGRAGLCDERDPPGHELVGHGGWVEPKRLGQVDEPHAVGAVDRHRAGRRKPAIRALLRVGEAVAEHHGGPHARPLQLEEHADDGGGGNGDHRRVGAGGERRDAGDGIVPVDRGRGRMHRDGLAGVADLAQVAQHAVALRLLAGRRADHGDGTGPQERLHIAPAGRRAVLRHRPFATQASAQFGCSLKAMSNCLSRLAKRVETAL